MRRFLCRGFECGIRNIDKGCCRRFSFTTSLAGSLGTVLFRQVSFQGLCAHGFLIEALLFQAVICTFIRRHAVAMNKLSVWNLVFQHSSRTWSYAYRVVSAYMCHPKRPIDA